MRDLYRPYARAIKLMKSIEKCPEKSPADRMILLSEVQKLIVDEIEKYYEGRVFNNSTEANEKFPGIWDCIPNMPKSSLVIDADQLLTISLYVLAESKTATAELHSHI